MSWSTSELRVRLAPLNRFKPSSKIFYWPFQGGTSFVDLLCFCSVLCLLCFVRVCLYVLRGHLLGKGWPLGSRLWCLLWVCHFPIGILGQVWYLIVSIPDLCNLTYFGNTTCKYCTLWLNSIILIAIAIAPSNAIVLPIQNWQTQLAPTIHILCIELYRQPFHFSGTTESTYQLAEIQYNDIVWCNPTNKHSNQECLSRNTSTISAKHNYNLADILDRFQQKILSDFIQVHKYIAL